MQGVGVPGPALSVSKEGTQDSQEYDTIGEVGEAADFLDHLSTIWGPGTLFKPNGRVFTRQTPNPFPYGSYTYRPATFSGMLTLLLLKVSLVCG